MNNMRTVTLKLLRTYVTKCRSETAGIRRKIMLIKAKENSENSLEDFDQEDGHVYDPEFSNITQAEREIQKSKQQLKQHIVKTKYFKEQTPPFLTYIEMDQIKKLYNSNPEEWTVQKLSESFPASPQIIKKVLKSRLVLESVDKIIKHDTKVIENWKNFKTGKLAVNPTLRKYLIKFKDRKISLIDKEVLEKMIPPKIKFPKPKCTFFSSILKESVDSEKLLCNEQLLSSQNNKNEKKLLMTEKKIMETSIKQLNNCNKVEPANRKNYAKKNENLLFTEFMQMKLDTSDDLSSEERVVLLDTYRKHIESTNSKDLSFDISNNATEHVKEEKDINVIKNSDKNILMAENEKQSEVIIRTDTESRSLDTCVKERKSNIEANFDYVQPIKIPKNAYKKGMTYRVQDCYYDDDGEFLYRVPGLKM